MLVILRIESVLTHRVIIFESQSHSAISHGLRPKVSTLIDLLGFLVASLTLIFGIFLCVGRTPSACDADEVPRLSWLALVLRYAAEEVRLRHETFWVVGLRATIKRLRIGVVLSIVTFLPFFVSFWTAAQLVGPLVVITRFITPRCKEI